MYVGRAQFSFTEGDRVKKHGLVACIRGSIVFFFVYVAVKHGKPDEESYANQVFHAFYVRVIIYQSENFFNFSQ